MPRPQRCRRICREPVYSQFTPAGPYEGGEVRLSLDEYEVIRLVDLEGRTHEQCAAQMDIARSTVTEIYESARRKLADCIVNGGRLIISGGSYRLCDGTAAGRCGKHCRRAQDGEAADIAQCQWKTKGEGTMRIAVTYEDGNVFQHFGHTERFQVYDVENGRIIQKTLVNTNGSGHGALADVLKKIGVEKLICGGIGGGARAALDEAGIELFGGVSGEADAAVEALLKGQLSYDPEAKCEHHGHEHGEGHSCGEHHCGGHDGAHQCHHHENEEGHPCHKDK